MPLPLPGYKDIVELLKAGATIEAQEKIMQLRVSALQLQEENFELRAEIRRLEEALTISTSLVREGNCYFKSEDERRERPFCLACWDADRKLVSLILGNDNRGNGTIRCAICDGRSKV